MTTETGHASGLTGTQAAAWRAFMEMQEALRGRIEQQLQADSTLSSTDYTVLAALSEAPDGRMRALSLSRALQWEKSRLHHQLTRMCRRGLVERRNEGRTSFAIITDAGRQAQESARPAHARHVRRMVFDRLTDQQVEQLAEISRAVLQGFADEHATEPIA
jgi:DNA-binding MarR family transcriptional regulator